MDGDGITFSYLNNNCLIIQGFCKSEPEFITNWHKIVKISDVLRTIHMYVFCIFHMHFSLNTRSVISIFKFNTRSLPVSISFQRDILKDSILSWPSVSKNKKKNRSATWNDFEIMKLNYQRYSKITLELAINFAGFMILQSLNFSSMNRVHWWESYCDIYS